MSATDSAISQTPDALGPITNIDLTIYALAVQSDGKILIAGYGAGNYLLTRINIDGTSDTNFHSQIFGEVKSMAVQPDGRILVTGYSGGTWVSRLNPDGTPDSSFKPEFNGYMGGMNSIVVQADGKVLIGGNFFSYGPGIARLNQDGSVDTNFNASVMLALYSCCAQVLAIQADGKVLVGGGFDHLDGAPRSDLGRVNGNGSLDSSFNPQVIGPPWAGSVVYSLVIQPDAKILVGGIFTNLAGQTRTNIGRLNQDGSLDELFNPGAGTGRFSPGVEGSVNCLALQADGKILVGGSFTYLGGKACTNIGRLNPDGSLDTNFNAWVSGNAGGTVYSVGLQSDGKVLIGGSFTNLSGQQRFNVGRLGNTEMATQSLAIDSSTIRWLRGGTGPEVWRTTFETTTNGTDWTGLGAGMRIQTEWQLSIAELPPNSVVRARGFVAVTPSSWFVETVLRPPFAISDVFYSANGHVGFNVRGPAGQVVVIKTSPDLSTWTPLQTNTLGVSPLPFSDPQPASFPSRYFRLRAGQ